MYGAILGDMIGAPYEFDRGDKTKTFKMWNKGVHFTDDTVMTIAIADALMSVPRDADEQTIKDAVTTSMLKWGRKYPGAGYGGAFREWLFSPNPQPYDSWGNGAAMRVSPVAWLYSNLWRVSEVAKWVTEVTHNHPEGIKGAQCTAEAIYMARVHEKAHRTKGSMKARLADKYGYDLTRTCDEIRPTYYHDESCQKTVPEALTAFFESNDFEDAIRTAISLGGDADTLAAITGSIAEAYYGVPISMKWMAIKHLPKDMIKVLRKFESKAKMVYTIGC